MIGDLWLIALGFAAGIVIAAYYYWRARVAFADLVAEKSRNARLRDERDEWRVKAARMDQVLGGGDVRAYWPKPMGGQKR